MWMQLVYTANKSSCGQPAGAEPLPHALCSGVIDVVHRVVPWGMPRLVGVRFHRVVVIMARQVIRVVVEDIVGVKATYQ